MTFRTLGVVVIVAWALTLPSAAPLAHGVFDYPISVAVDPQGNVVVAERNRHQIDKYDANGSLKWTLGVFGSGPGQFNFPMGITVDSRGNIFVADYGNSRIQKFDADSHFITMWRGMQTSSSGQPIVTPVAVAVDSSDNVYVLEQAAFRVQKFSNDGNQQLGIWYDGTLVQPSDLVVDPGGGYAYISDTGNHRIMKYALASNVSGMNASFIGWAGRCTSGIHCNVANQRSRGFTCTSLTCSRPSAGTGLGQFNNPMGLGLDTQGNLAVADYGNNRVQRFFYVISYDPVYRPGNINNRLHLFTNKIPSVLPIPSPLVSWPDHWSGPTDVAVRTPGVFWIADSGNSRIARVNTLVSPFSNMAYPFSVGGDVLVAARNSPPLDVDPIFDRRAVTVFPNKTAQSTISLGSLADFGGFVMPVGATCCTELLTNAPVTSSVPPISGPISPIWVPRAGFAVPTTLSYTSSGLPPGKFVATASVQDLARTFTHDLKIGFEVLPPWPADGPPPACMGVLPGQLLNLSNLDLHSWRQTFPSSMPPSQYAAGVQLLNSGGVCPGQTVCHNPAFELDIQGSAGALRSDQAIIDFVDQTEVPTIKIVRTSNSRNCSQAGQMLTMLPGQKYQLVINKADTSTLFFLSGSSSAISAAFSEGPFWAFFGGRHAKITFLGTW